MAEIILSNRGKEKFASDGYIYVMDRLSSDNVTTFWRCEQKDRCKARVHTRSKQIVKKINEHSHDSAASRVEVAALRTRIKRRAEETVEPTVQVINECTAEVSQATYGAIPNYSALRKIVQRKRNEVNRAPSNPANLIDLVLPEIYKKYMPMHGDEENFLLRDSGPGLNRILIFGRQVNLENLRDSTTWYADGTFSIAPSLFSQIYIIMAEKYGGIHPLFYILLPNKQRDTYNQMFDMLKTLEPRLHPRAIHCDFEQAAFHSMSEAFPGVHIYGCFFHLAQNMRKHICSIGLMRSYNNDPEFSLKAKMIIALAFVPRAYMDEAVADLSEELPLALVPILDWFEDNYIGRPNRRGNGRRAPLFPIDMWNLFHRTLNGEDRTNNHAEAAHRRLKTELGMDHPTIWKLIDGLRKVQRGRDIYYESLVAGNIPPLKLKKYRDADSRIALIVRDFENRELIEFLRGIAHNYQMGQ